MFFPFKNKTTHQKTQFITGSIIIVFISLQMNKTKFQNSYKMKITHKIKKSGLTAFMLCLLLNLYAADEQILAFPDAEGFGKYATGGRGGRVVEVTTLKDSLVSGVPIEGSLRAALKTEGNDPITIVFRVSGRIDLVERLKCGRNNITIAGQSAPGDGICISGNNIYFSGQNLIIRYLRFRTGDAQGVNASCVNIENAKNFIVDHCSFSWSMEENMTIYDNNYSTVQWCIVSEPLYRSAHSKGDRGYASQWGGQYASYHHNLIAHAYSRAPRVNGARSKNDTIVLNDFVNNVIYNWGKQNSVYGGEVTVENGECLTNWVNNYYKPGPASPSKFYFAEASYSSSNPAYGKWYVSGNYIDNTAFATANADNHKAMNYKGGEVNHRSDERFEVENVNTTTAAQAYVDVLANAGARIPRLDAIDRRIIAEAKGELTPVYGGVLGATKGIIDSQDNIGGWPEYESAIAPTDTDKDGIPDDWETENGLNPNDANDGATITESGYSNLEIYLNSIMPTETSSIKTVNKNAAQIYIDLSQRILHVSSEQIVDEIVIYNSQSGIKVFSKELQSTYGLIPLHFLPKGMYIIGLKSADGGCEFDKIVL